MNNVGSRSRIIIKANCILSFIGPAPDVKDLGHR